MDIYLWSLCISIHAPRGGSDMLTIVFGSPGADFNPRSPRGERRRCMCAPERRNFISIHAPRGGSDGPVLLSPSYHRYFNPRSPRGERRRKPKQQAGTKVYFNPRSPRGERRPANALSQRIYVISIHAPRGGSDAVQPLQAGVHTANFNPRSPRGERHVFRSPFSCG